MLGTLSSSVVSLMVERALAEDLGQTGDLTGTHFIAADAQLVAVIEARNAGVLCGIELACETFRRMGPDLRLQLCKQDGERLQAGDIVMHVAGNARAILAAERSALNFLGHLSGITSMTQSVVDRLRPPTKLLCTRKTTPGLRVVEKYAVRCGGGVNHRFGLFDAVMLKDNHKHALSGDLAQAVRRFREKTGPLSAVEVEIDSMAELNPAIEAAPDAILFDNFSPQEARLACGLCPKTIKTELSGGITPENIDAYADVGADYLSMGAITHHAVWLDFGLDIKS